MLKLAVLFVSFIGILGLSVPQNIEEPKLSDVNTHQQSYQNDEGAMIKPAAYKSIIFNLSSNFNFIIKTPKSFQFYLV